MELCSLGKTGTSIPAVGLGTWGIGGGMRPDSSNDAEAVEALTLGLDLGMSLIDTAEMYGAGHSEDVVSRVVEGRRDSVFIASKVSPSHFAYDDVLHSAQMSLKRLGVKQIDLYQLHWPNPRIPISETMRAMGKLADDGFIRYIGVSNFSTQQMREAQQALSRHEIVSNQVEYSLLERSIEADILPYCKREGITLIAYSPLSQGKIARGRGGPFKMLNEIADRLGKTRSQVALNWLLRDDSVVVIPKAIRKEHIQENAQASSWKLSREDYERLSQAFA